MVFSGGHVWFFQGEGACVVFLGGAWFFGGRHAWFFSGGMCMVVGGACIGYNEIWSMSGRYASYWNASLFEGRFTCNEIQSDI